MTASCPRNFLFFAFLLVFYGTGCAGGGATTSTGTVPTPPNPGISTVIARAYASLPQGSADANPQVEVRWTVDADIPPSSVINFLIFRDGDLVDSAPAQANSYTDSTDLSGTFDYAYPAFNQSSPSRAVTEVNESVSLTTIRDNSRVPLTVGDSHRYRVAVVYRFVRDGLTLYRITNLGSESGSATPLARPRIARFNFPSSGYDPARIQVYYNTVRGANQYILEFADNPQFNNRQASAPFRAEYAENFLTLSPEANLTTLLPNLQNSNGMRIYYRLGARNTDDVPGILPRDTPNGDAYIYSASASFETGEPPPGNP